MSGFYAGTTLPASISGPTAWAAFGHVLSSKSWSITVGSGDQPDLDVKVTTEFEDFLSGVTRFSYAAQARGFLATRILEIVEGITPARLRDLNTSDPGRLRDYVKTTLQNELDQRFSLSSWEDRVRERLTYLPEHQRLAIVRHLGLDQLVSAQIARSSVAYVFTRLSRREDGKIDLDHWRASDVRKRQASGSDSDRGRGLALRATVALYDRLIADAGPEPDLAILTDVLEDMTRRMTSEHGAWPLIALALTADREAAQVPVPKLNDPVLEDLIERQAALLGYVLDPVLRTMPDTEPQRA